MSCRQTAVQPCMQRHSGIPAAFVAPSAGSYSHRPSLTLHVCCYCLLLLPAAAAAAADVAPWHLRSQAALQADQQFSSAPAAFKQQQQQQLNAYQQPQVQQAIPAVQDVSTSDSDSDSGGPVRVPLKLVVQDAVKRWFNETLSEARRGDVKQQALLSQMYAEGYGCKQDLEQAKIWGERARLRGYQMAGVYDAF